MGPLPVCRQQCPLEATVACDPPSLSGPLPGCRRAGRWPKAQDTQSGKMRLEAKVPLAVAICCCHVHSHAQAHSLVHRCPEEAGTGRRNGLRQKGPPCGAEEMRFSGAPTQALGNGASREGGSVHPAAPSPSPSYTQGRDPTQRHTLTMTSHSHTLASGGGPHSAVPVTSPAVQS